MDVLREEIQGQYAVFLGKVVGMHERYGEPIDLNGCDLHEKSLH